MKHAAKYTVLWPSSLRFRETLSSLELRLNARLKTGLKTVEYSAAQSLALLSSSTVNPPKKICTYSNRAHN